LNLSVVIDNNFIINVINGIHVGINQCLSLI